MADEEIRLKYVPDTSAAERSLGNINTKLRQQAGQVRNVVNEFGDYRDAMGRLRNAQGRYIRDTDRATQATNKFTSQGKRDVNEFARIVNSRLTDEFDNRLPRALAKSRNATAQFAGQSRRNMLLTQVAAYSVAGAISGGITAALAVAGAGLNKFKNDFIAAADDEVERVGRVQQAIQALDLSREQARRYNQETELAIARSGADLPVRVRDIQSFYGAGGDELAEYLRSQGIGLQGIRRQTVSTSSQLAILQQLSGVDTANALANIQAYLGGAGAGELRQMVLFQRNPKLQRELQAGIQAGENRVALLIRALDGFVTDDMIQDLQGTTKARFSAFMDRMFDPTIGLFSISRDLEPEIPGYQSVATELGETVRLVFEEGGLIDAFSDALNLLDGDPMVRLRESIQGLNEFITDLTEFLNAVDNARNSNRFADAGIDALTTIFKPGFGLGQSNAADIVAEPRFRGTLPGPGPMDLMSAIATEIRNKPIGSHLLITNSSETVVARGEQASQGNTTIGALHIHIHQQPGENTDRLVQKVIQAIDEEYTLEKDSWL